MQWQGGFQTLFMPKKDKTNTQTRGTGQNNTSKGGWGGEGG